MAMDSSPQTHRTKLIHRRSPCRSVERSRIRPTSFLLVRRDKSLQDQLARRVLVPASHPCCAIHLLAYPFRAYPSIRPRSGPNLLVMPTESSFRYAPNRRPEEYLRVVPRSPRNSQYSASLLPQPPRIHCPKKWPTANQSLQRKSNQSPTKHRTTREYRATSDVRPL